MKYRIAICAVLAAFAVPLMFLQEEKPTVTARILAKPNEWELTGDVVFRKGGKVMFFGYSDWFLTRGVPFKLILPNDRGYMGSGIYEPLAIQATKAAPVKWDVNYLAIVLGWFSAFLCLMVFWWFLRRLLSTPRTHSPQLNEVLAK